MANLAICVNLAPPDLQFSDIRNNYYSQKFVLLHFYCITNAIIAILRNQAALPFLHALGKFCHSYDWFCQMSQFRIFRFFCKKSNICFRISQKSKYAENQHVYLQTITLTGSSSAISTSSSSASSFGSSLISSPCSSLFSSTRFPIAPPEKYYSKHIFIHNFIKLELNLRFIKY